MLEGLRKQREEARPVASVPMEETPIPQVPSGEPVVPLAQLGNVVSPTIPLFRGGDAGPVVASNVSGVPLAPGSSGVERVPLAPGSAEPVGARSVSQATSASEAVNLPEAALPKATPLFTSLD